MDFTLSVKPKIPLIEALYAYYIMPLATPF